MFENLTEKLNITFKRLTGRGKLTESNIQDALRQVRLALLEADVNYKVVKGLIEDIRTRAIGQEVLGSLTPGQQFIKIVNEELIRLMGGERAPLNLTGRTPHCLMLVGLQGSGKTTTAAKLANHLKKKGRHPYLVPADVYRPAAIDQLKKLGAEISVPVYDTSPTAKPEDICVEARMAAGREGADLLIIDTAGRLHIDEALMGELVRIKEKILPQEILLVADAMTGQDAVNVARRFNEVLDISGVILTKMEGDARGGAALSIRAVTLKPIKFIGVGEKIDALEAFFPDRMASRILGMGDVLTLIEKAQEEFDQKEALKLEKKLKKAEFDFEDFLGQLKQIKKLGSLEQILSMLPGMGQLKKLKQLKPDEKELVKVEAIINSMTREERRNYKIINGSRRKRIARGSGTSVQDVNRLIKNFAQMKKMMERFSKKGPRSIPSFFP
ncbi:MAG: signal recognition particle protein [Deltaproteobacteria bacterium]|nr:signal recognition particle protein [Deltaproteobacteria bacterium]MBW1927629.1 signal recognition particle protein [Deltaproteobacteria bacterium]MBW2025582.1 signal recognition particle protein [Deltaproteobacteria bacterium]MBW2126200.1 signal recognition particle protein [Deltaproteobacteria bacterium]